MRIRVKDQTTKTWYFITLFLGTPKPSFVLQDLQNYPAFLSKYYPHLTKMPFMSIQNIIYWSCRTFLERPSKNTKRHKKNNNSKIV